MSITPFKPDDGQDERVDALAHILEGYALLGQRAASLLDQKVEKLGGEVDIVKQELEETANDVKALEARVDSVEAAQTNGTSAPTHKMFIWAMVCISFVWLG